MAEGIGTDPISILNRILHSLTCIKVALECLSNATKSLKGNVQQYEFQFDAAGRFRGLVPRAEPVVCIMPPDDFCLSAESNCRFIPQHVDALRTARDDADAAINELPASFRGTLSTSAGNSWTFLVRRELLNDVTVWPGDSLTYHAIGSKKIPTHMPTFLDYLAEQDPLPQWEAYQRRIGELKKDVVALSGEVGVQPTEQKISMAADNPAAVHLGTPPTEKRQGYLGLQFDDGRRLVSRDGYDEPVDLSGSELYWGIVNALSKSKDAPLSDDGLRAVWDKHGIARNPSKGTVQDAISELRKRIKPLELTVTRKRKLGYLIEAISDSTPN